MHFLPASVVAGRSEIAGSSQYFVESRKVITAKDIDPGTPGQPQPAVKLQEGTAPQRVLAL